MAGEDDLPRRDVLDAGTLSNLAGDNARPRLDGAAADGVSTSNAAGDVALPRLDEAAPEGASTSNAAARSCPGWRWALRWRRDTPTCDDAVAPSLVGSVRRVTESGARGARCSPPAAAATPFFAGEITATVDGGGGGWLRLFPVSSSHADSTSLMSRTEFATSSAASAVGAPSLRTTF